MRTRGKKGCQSNVTPQSQADCFLPIDQTLTQIKHYFIAGNKLIHMSTFFTKELARRTKPRFTLSTYHDKTLITSNGWKIVAAIKLVACGTYQ
jgi:hypothetical protein